MQSTERTPRWLHAQGVKMHALVFAAYFIAAKASLYFYYGFETSPALIWPPVGIALAAVILWGYRMWVPIFLAQFLALVTHVPGVYDIAALIAAGYALQAVAGAFVLRWLKFDPSLETLRSVLALVVVALLITLIEPAVATAAQWLLGTLSVDPLLNLGRAWGAGVFSVFVFTPFILTWYPWRTLELARDELLELLAALLLVVTVSFFLFWTPYPQALGILVIFLLPAALMWLVLRFPVRFFTLGIMLTALLAIAGTALANPSDNPLNTQLLAVEIYVGLVAAIFLIFTTLVSERRAAYAKLVEAYESTSASDTAKSEFIAILAHELRNPLAPIVSSLEFLKLQPQTPESMETIENAHEQTIMIKRMLDDLLDTVRISQRKFQLQKEAVSVREVVKQSVASVDDFIRSARHELILAIPEDDIVCHADFVRLKQVVINLLNNACKYTEPGGTITLAVERINGEVVIRVSDTGIGMSKTTMRKLFEPFKQNMQTQRGTGLGIGLYLTKLLVEMHGGRIAAASEGPGSGSTFTVHIPVSSAAGTVGSIPSMPRRIQPVLPESAHILVVDDNEVAANALQKLLQHHAFEVTVAYSGPQALEMLQRLKADMILLDIGMPDMDGYETARQIRSKGWTGKLVALTGYGQESDRQRSKEAGFDNHLVKPVLAADIVGLLADMQQPA